MERGGDNQKTWIEFLSDEDLAFIKRFVLASGSLKELAEAYGVTYPTIRLRLDRLISKIQVAEAERTMSRFERLARTKYADGKIDLETLKSLLRAHREEMDGTDEKRSGQ